MAARNDRSIQAIVEISSPQAPQPVSIERIIERIHVDGRSPIPSMVLCLGPCRSGTTAILRLIAESGVKSYSQPIKGILRHLAKGTLDSRCDWFVPNCSWICLKETSGPFNRAESTLDYLKVLSEVYSHSLPEGFRERGQRDSSIAWMRANLHVVVIGREVHDTWVSWREAHRRVMKHVEATERWYYETSDDGLFDNFVSAFQSVERMRQTALESSIPVTHYVSELNAQPVAASVALFRRIGLPFEPTSLGWTKQFSFDNSDDMILSHDHALQVQSGLFDRVKNSQGLTYFPGRGAELDRAERTRIAAASVQSIYENWRVCAQRDLGIDLGDLTACQNG